jgi:hypothetical protein
MIRNLTIVAVASFVLAIGCFGGAIALGGRDLLKNGWVVPSDWHVEVNDDHDHISINPGGATVEEGETTERQIAWTGSDALQVDVPAEVTFTQAASGAAITVSGPRRLVDRVVVEGGQIRLKGGDEGAVGIHGVGFHVTRGDNPLTIQVTAPAVRNFTLNGGGDLKLRAYDQPTMTLEINGSGDVQAEGKATKLDLRVSGSGEADLSQLDAGDTKVSVAGSGSARIAPHGAAEVAVAGSGDVDVTTKPTSLVTNVAGSGEVNQNW